MTNLRIIISVVMITLLSGITAVAQPGGQQGPPSLPSDKQIKKMVKDLDKTLNLEDQQETEISALYFDHFDTIESIQKEQQRPDRQEMEKLKSELETDVKALLNEEQKAGYTAWLKKQEKQKGGQKPQGGSGGQRPPR